MYTNKKPSQLKLLTNIQRFKRDIRLKHYFAGEPTDPDYIKYKKLYIKSDWEPEQYDLKLENTLTNFENKLIRERARIISHSYDRSNLTTQQKHMMKILKRTKKTNSP